ncbi:hypothetical protein ACFX13_000703 [Malus domestica]
MATHKKLFWLIRFYSFSPPLKVNIFQGITLPDAPSFGQVFGGQLVGQALAAATKTVDCLKLLHSVHAHFLLAGDCNSK